MKPIDYRNESWERVQARLVLDRARVHSALITSGPCTTRHLAAKMGWDILNVRPRVTELVQIGFAALVDRASSGYEGVYRALPFAEAKRNFEEKRRAALEANQLNLL